MSAPAALEALAAVVVRLAAMPFSAHGDVFFVHAYPALFWRNGIWDVYAPAHASYFPPGVSYYPPLVFFGIALLQKVSSVLAPDLWAALDSARLLIAGRGAPDFAGFLVSTPGIRRLLFALKLPYLALDGLCGWLVSRSFAEGGDRTRAARLWAWNPVVIFSTYVLGQYRVLSAAAMLGAFVLARRGRVFRAGVVYGAVCLMENYALFLVPVWVLALEGGFRRRVRLLAATLALPALVGIPLAVHSAGGVWHAYYSASLRRGMGQGIFNHFPEIVGPACNVLFFAVFAAVCGLLAKSRRTPPPERLFVPAGALLLLVLYATHVTSVHYWMWGLPFFIPLQVRRTAWTPAWTWGLVGLLFLFNLDTRALNLGLFVPLDAAAASMPSLHELLQPHLPWGTVIGASRALFSAGCLALAWRIYRLELAPSLSTPGERP